MRVSIIGLTLLLGLAATPAFAQKLERGIKLGPTISTIVFDAAVDGDGLFGPGGDAGYRRKVSIGGGGFVVLPLAGPLGFEIEGLFTPKGGKLPEEFDSTLIINYLEFPLLGRMTAVRSKSASFFVFGGPSPAFRIEAKHKIEQRTGPITNGLVDDVSSGINRFEVALIAGAGVNVGRYAVIDARYSWGLSDINHGPDPTVVVRNRAFTVLAGVRF